MRILVYVLCSVWLDLIHSVRMRPRMSIFLRFSPVRNRRSPTLNDRRSSGENLSESTLRSDSALVHPPTEFIELSHVPSCVNCRFFIPTTHLCYAKCAKFGTKDMVTGVVEHRYASTCRESSILCREDGRYYEEAPKNDPVPERKEREEREERKERKECEDNEREGTCDL